MTRAEILQQAASYVTKDREQQYGNPENNFNTISVFWTTYLHAKFDVTLPLMPEDAANMMALLKLARIATGKFKADSYVDAVGYLSIGGEISGKGSK